MRLFVAAELGEALAANAAVVIDELKRRVVRLAPAAKVTWVSPDRLHVTIRFIGEVSDVHAGRIQQVLAPPFSIMPFDLAAQGVGAFPKTGQPRVIWAGLTTGRADLLGVERVVTQRLAHVDVAPEPRAFSPHLTLARVRDAAGLRSGMLFRGLPSTTIGTTTIHAITLFESRLSSKGPTYIPLVQTPLASTEPV